MLINTYVGQRPIKIRRFNAGGEMHKTESNSDTLGKHSVGDRKSNRIEYSLGYIVRWQFDCGTLTSFGFVVPGFSAIARQPQ